MKAKVKNICVTVVFAVLVFGFAVGFILKPADEFSLSERRALVQFPALNTQTVFSAKFMSDFEKYTLDQFPLRDSFRTLKAIVADKIFGQLDNNGIYVENGYAAAMEYPLKTDSIDHAAKCFNTIKERYLNESNRIFLSVIPDKNYFLADYSGRLSLDYDKLIDRLCEKTEGEEYIDIFPLLEIEDYYKTDTHWRQEKIADVAQALAGATGVKLKLEGLTEKVLNKEFYGVYHGQSALPLDGESLVYLDGGVLEGCRVYDHQNEKQTSFYDMEKANGKDPYELFMSGSISLMSVENPAAENDRHLIIFRDSFGSSIAPLLATGYSEITLVDIRYIRSDVIGRFIDFENSDVLFLYSTLVLNNSETMR